MRRRGKSEDQANKPGRVRRTSPGRVTRERCRGAGPCRHVNALPTTTFRGQRGWLNRGIGEGTSKAAPSVAIMMFVSRFGSKLDDADEEQNHDNDDDDADDSYATTSCVHLDLPIQRRIKAVDSLLRVDLPSAGHVNVGSRCSSR